MENNDYELLHVGLKRFIYKKGWGSLRDIQKKAIKPILEHKNDVIIAASTASGKTEAAFLPALSAITQNPHKGVKILCISPLKALINDQAKRIEEMAQYVNLSVAPWHGDVSSHLRKKVVENEDVDVLIITPESLESLFVNKKNYLSKILLHLDYIIVDEFHAFIDTVRGEQLMSLMHRVDMLLGKIVTRIAISATFASIDNAALYLRPNNYTNQKVLIIEDSNSKGSLSVQIRGYRTQFSKERLDENGRVLGYTQISNDIYRLLRGSSNLVFCNTKAITETVASDLTSLSSKNHVPLEFFPHHGSLSKDLREDLEHRLKQSKLPTTAICTATLELGIDIADVSSIGQIDAPPSPASLRQRLGRSGRRDGNAVLRIFALERECDDAPDMLIHLNENTVLCAATISLILKRKYDTEDEKRYYSLSTLVQQILSEISSGNGVKAQYLYNLLCTTGPFNYIEPKIFAKVLRSLGQNDLIEQLKDGSLILGLNGERVCSTYNFYSAFASEQEYRIEHDGKTIGTVPSLQTIAIGDSFLFAGKGWEVVFFNRDTHTVGVKPFPFKAEPLSFAGGANTQRSHIRDEMYHIYLTGEYPKCTNKEAEFNIQRGRELFFKLGLDKKHVVESVEGLALYPWCSDAILNTILLILKARLIHGFRIASHIELISCSMDNFKAAVAGIIRDNIDPMVLSNFIVNLDLNKFDIYLDDDLKKLSYINQELDIEGAMKFFRLIAKEI